MSPRAATSWSVADDEEILPPPQISYYYTRRVTYCRPHITWAAALVVLVATFVTRQQDTVLASTASTSSHHHSQLQRGQILSHNDVTAEELYHAYKEIQQEYQEKAFDKNNRWKLLNRKDGVEIKMLQHPSDPSCPYVQMKAVIPTSVKDCWDFLRLERWDETMRVMDPFYEGVELIEDYMYRGVHMLLARKRTQRILAFGKRDFVFISVSDKPLSDGTWVSGTVSVITNRVPRVPSYTRAFQDSIAFYKPLSPNKTEMTIVCRIDMNDRSANGAGGNMPMWLYVQTIGQTGLRSVVSMRNYLVKELSEREAQLEAAHEREKRMHQMSLPWMEWPVAEKEPPVEEKKPLFGLDWIRPPGAEPRRRAKARTLSKRTRQLRKQWHRILLPWMVWPEKKKEKPVPKEKSLRRRLHELILPWMEWTEDEEEFEEEEDEDEWMEDDGGPPFTMPWDKRGEKPTTVEEAERDYLPWMARR